MPSIAKIFSYAAVAFAAFAAAAPTGNTGDNGLVNVHHNKVEVLDRRGDNGLVNIHDNEVEVLDLDRRGGCACAEPGVPSLVGIIADLKVNVKVDVDALLAIKKETCDVEHIKPIVVSIVAKINAAVDAVVKLGKYKRDQILFDGNVAVSIDVFVELLVSVIISICAALEVCLRLIVKLDVEVYGLLCLVGTAIATLIHVIINLLVSVSVDIIAILIVKLKACFWVFVKLHLWDICSLLKINIKAFINL